MPLPTRSVIAAAALLVGMTVATAAERTITLDVDNASCVTCAPIIKAAISRVPGVRQVTIVEDAEYTSAIVTVIFDDSKATPEMLASASTNAGYPTKVSAPKVSAPKVSAPK